MPESERSGSVERRWSIAVCDGCWKLAKTAPGLDVYCDCDAYQEDDAQIVAVEVVPLTTLNRQREALEDIAAAAEKRARDAVRFQADRIADVRSAEAELARLRRAVRPILSAYRSEPATITEEQITKAWEAFDG